MSLTLLGCAGTPPHSAAPSSDRQLQTTAHRSEAEAERAANPDDLICTYEKTTGSHLSQRVCRTVAQREQMREAAQHSMRHSRGACTSNCGDGAR